MTLGALFDVPGMVDLLTEATGKTKDQLGEMAKAGKLTGEQLIGYLAKPNAALDKAINKTGVSVGDAMQRIRNELARASAQLWKLTGGFSYLGTAIWKTFSAISWVIRGFIDLLGGLQNTLEVVGIALGLILGPVMLRNAIMLTAQFIEMAVASWAVWAPWLAIGAAVALVAIAIQDIYLWMTNPKAKTVMGDMVGPFADFKKQIEDFPLVKLMTGIKDVFKGDTTKGFTEIKEAIGSVDSVVKILLGSIGLVAGAFKAWNVLKFAGIIGALEEVGRAITGNKTKATIRKEEIAREAKEAKDKVEAAKNAATGGDGKPAKSTTTTETKPGEPATAKPTAPKPGPSILSMVTFAGFLYDAVRQASFQLDELDKNDPRWSIVKKEDQLKYPNSPAARQAAGENVAPTGMNDPKWSEKTFGVNPEKVADQIGGFFSNLYNSFKKSVIDSAEKPVTFEARSDQVPIRPLSAEDIAAYKTERDRGLPPIQPAQVPQPEQAFVPGPQLEQVSQFFNDLIKQVIKFDDWDVSKTGAAGPASNTVNAGGINQTNNINVTAQMNEEQVAAAVRSAVMANVPTLLEQVTRTVTDAMPLTDKAAH
jgi:hypothetical protein